MLHTCTGGATLGSNWAMARSGFLWKNMYGYVGEAQPINTYSLALRQLGCLQTQQRCLSQFVRLSAMEHGTSQESHWSLLLLERANPSTLVTSPF
jgi:hypothetical protein